MRIPPRTTTPTISGIACSGDSDSTQSEVSTQDVCMPPAFQTMLSRIKKIKPIKATYRHDGEQSINPAYTDIASSLPLCMHEKRIFVFRSDLILATGIKNVCVWEGNTDLFAISDPATHGYIDKKDRYGHPSLAMPDPDSGYDGSVYYAGWVCQRENHLKIFLQSGRYHQHEMNELQKSDVELYIVHQFMKSYGRQDILIYDCEEDEKLTLFLTDKFPAEKAYRVYTPEILDAVLAKAHLDEIALYENKMAEIEVQLIKSLQRLSVDPDFNQAAKPACIDQIKILALRKNAAHPDQPCFDDLWNQLRDIFDLVMYHPYKSDVIDLSTRKFKHVIRSLLRMGIPFVDGRNICLWSTRFARNEAVRFCQDRDMVVDGVAQEYLRGILLGWPDGKLNVFYHLVKNPDPLFPTLSVVFWNAMTDVFVREIQKNSTVHLFYQDALTVGNFFWDVELPIIRKRNASVLLHQYNLAESKWLPPIRMDSVDGHQVYLRRRNLHISEINDPQLNPLLIKYESGKMIWKQEFEMNKNDNKIINWTSPRLITIGKMKELANRWMIAAKRSKMTLFTSEPTAINESIATNQISSSCSVPF